MGELKQALQQEFNVALRSERDSAAIMTLVCLTSYACISDDTCCLSE